VAQPQGDGRAATGPARYVDQVRTRRLAIVLVGAILVAATCFMATAATAASQGPSPHVSSIWLKSATYTPKAPPGATDDYHCTVVDPHIAHTSYIVSSQFFPGSVEDHHAALFLLPPSLVAQARRDEVFKNGWTCFGEGTLPNTPLADFAETTLLSNWSPGSGAIDFPTDTGFVVPAGSMVIMQVHYNLLVGDKAVKNSLVLHTVPLSTPLLPLHVQEIEAAPDIPCPTGVTGPLCNRATSLADQGHRFGQTAVVEVDGIEALCGRNPSDPPEGNSTSCTQSMSTGGYIVRVAPHMHLLGVGFSMVVDPGTPEAKTVLTVPNYDFHHQRAYNLATPVRVTAGEPVEMTCTYNPTLAQELPVLRKVPPHFVTWGDGSTDEMCVGVTWTSATLPSAHNSV
jgi:Copper type II ascorbate-dependent monooxygenase, C-terminal domain